MDGESIKERERSGEVTCILKIDNAYK
ncbi:Protein of unknown function [Bacillus mycoides]|uniref:Uncharacterized protein n=1 Tax=Bacillus mycoides TaxID=1405 RepID=A0A1G4EMK3_BACMY|nr:Protein of unknown function [Bacillus mycoides]